MASIRPPGRTACTWWRRTSTASGRWKSSNRMTTASNGAPSRNVRASPSSKRTGSKPAAPLEPDVLEARRPPPRLGDLEHGRGLVDADHLAARPHHVRDGEGDVA